MAKMATSSESEAEDQYEARFDDTGGDVPSDEVKDNSYVFEDEKEPIPVEPDDAPVEDPVQPPESNSDEELGNLLHLHESHTSNASVKIRQATAQDEAEVVVDHKVIGERTRGATKPAGTYREPGDEEGLPAGNDTGRSNIKGL
jgi:hypothetical protein